MDLGPIPSSSMLADDQDLAPRYVPESQIIPAHEASRMMGSSSINASDYARPVGSSSVLQSDYARPVASSSILASDYARPMMSSSVLESDDLAPRYVPSSRVRNSGNGASMTQSELNPFRSSSMQASDMYQSELNPFGSSSLRTSELQPPRTGLYTIPSESALHDSMAMHSQPLYQDQLYSASLQVPAVAEPMGYQQEDRMTQRPTQDRPVYQEPVAQEPQVGSAYVDRFSNRPVDEPSLQRQIAERFALGDIKVRTVRIEYKEPDYLFPYHNPLADVGCDFVGHQDELPGHYQLEPTPSRVTVH